MPFLLGRCWDEVGSAVNESVTVRSEERAIYTHSRNLTVQIYVGSSDTDLGTFDLNRKHCSHRVKVRTSKSMSKLPTNVRTSDGRDSRRTSGLLTCADNQPARP